MCLKEHKYYVCNCQNEKCPAKYTLCCPYGPKPLSLQELGHFVPNCKSTETPCANQQQQQGSLVVEPCKDAKVKSVSQDIGVCVDCQMGGCMDKQTEDPRDVNFSALFDRRYAEEKERKEQLEKDWGRTGDSDAEFVE
jgi:hypothetical protein